MSMMQHVIDEIYELEYNELIIIQKEIEEAILLKTPEELL